MNQEKILEIVKSELEISGISDMSIEEEVKSSKKEIGFHKICSRLGHWIDGPRTSRSERGLDGPVWTGVSIFRFEYDRTSSPCSKIHWV